MKRPVRNSEETEECARSLIPLLLLEADPDQASDSDVSADQASDVSVGKMHYAPSLSLL